MMSSLNDMSVNFVESVDTVSIVNIAKTVESVNIIGNVKTVRGVASVTDGIW